MASRRGHKEGSIHQRKDGRWVASVNLGWVDGKRKRKHYFASTRKEAAEKLKVALRDQQLGLPVAMERQTVEQYLALARGLGKAHRPVQDLAELPADRQTVYRTLNRQGSAIPTHTPTGPDIAEPAPQERIVRSNCAVLPRRLAQGPGHGIQVGYGFA